MRCSFRRRHASHGAGPGLAAIACLTGAALAVNGAARNVPAVLRGATDVLEAATTGAAVLAAVAVLVVITWAALRLGRRAWLQEEAPGHPEPGGTVPKPEPGGTVPKPEPAVVPVPERLPGRPLFISGLVRRGMPAEAAADQEAAR